MRETSLRAPWSPRSAKQFSPAREAVHQYPTPSRTGPAFSFAGLLIHQQGGLQRAKRCWHYSRAPGNDHSQARRGCLATAGGSAFGKPPTPHWAKLFSTSADETSSDHPHSTARSTCTGCRSSESLWLYHCSTSNHLPRFWAHRITTEASIDCCRSVHVTRDLLRFGALKKLPACSQTCLPHIADPPTTPSPLINTTRPPSPTRVSH